ncbi:hypothetical protein M0R45_000061 [Rubus argutus]|uniref:Uncharacterized protein n=1 Tax=Rubus argutus TaxID=59490 RepID=A0AAW1VP92_RUBAR
MTGGRGHGIPSSACWAWHRQRRLERSKLGSLADSGAVERGAGSGMAGLRGQEMVGFVGFVIGVWVR